MSRLKLKCLTVVAGRHYDEYEPVQHCLSETWQPRRCPMSAAPQSGTPVRTGPWRTRPRLRRRLAIVAVAAVTGAALMVVTGASSGSAATADRGSARDVVANLFEWNWNSVAKECTTVLGPHGYGGVQVAPPQD